MCSGHSKTLYIKFKSNFKKTNNSVIRSYIQYVVDTLFYHDLNIVYNVHLHVFLHLHYFNTNCFCVYF